MLEPLKLKLPSFKGFTKVHAPFKVEDVKSSETTEPEVVPTVVGSEAESLAVLVSLPPETVATLVALVAVPATLTFSVTAG